MAEEKEGLMETPQPFRGGEFENQILPIQT